MPYRVKYGLYFLYKILVEHHALTDIFNTDMLVGMMYNSYYKDYNTDFYFFQHQYKFTAAVAADISRKIPVGFSRLLCKMFKISKEEAFFCAFIILIFY